MVKSRRRAREAVLQALYEIEVGGSDPADAIRRMGEASEMPPELEAFAQGLANGILQNLLALDQRLSPLVTDYSWKRVAAVDRNIMRIAAYELLFLPHMPPAVSLNEAIEIAKKYSTAESGRFVNGVLGKLLLDTDKVAWNPQDHPADISEEPAAAEQPPVEEAVPEGPEADKLLKVGPWKIRRDDE